MVADVIVCVAPVPLQIERVLRDGVEDAGVVQIVAPGVGELAGEAVPCIGLQRNLQRVVTGRGGGVDLVDDAEVGELGEVGPRGLLVAECVSIHRYGRGVLVASQGILVDVLQDEVVAAGRADITDVQLPSLPQLLFDVETEELDVGCFEVAADRVDGDDVAARRLTLGRRKDRCRLVVVPHWNRISTGVDAGAVDDRLIRLGADRVVVRAAGALVGDADVAKVGLPSGLVIVHAEVGADDRARKRLVGESDARRDIDLVAVVDVIRCA